MSSNTFSYQHFTNMFEFKPDFHFFEQLWVPDEKPLGIVLIVHGIAEHSGRYAHVAETLAGKGYGVMAYDLRGHGQTTGKRTYIKSFDQHLNDLDLMVERIKSKFSEDRLFLFGHSMGGAIVSLYAIENQPQIEGLILSAPAVKISDDISPLLQKMSAVIGAILPTLPTIKLDSSGISRDPEVVKAYDTDPLNYRGGTLARTGAEIIRATKRIQAGLDKLTLPFLVFHGTEDRLADVEGSKLLYNGAASKDKTLKLYDGFYHECMNEPEKDKVFQDILNWLDLHGNH